MQTLLSLALLFAVPQDPEAPFLRWHWFVDDDRVALAGYDPVAYHLLDEAVPGDPELELEHRGVRYRFVDPEHRDRFAQEPESYLPAHGGWCSWALSQDASTTGAAPQRLAPDPTHFQRIDGRIHLFARGPGFDGKRSWESAPQATRERADAFWASREALAARIGPLPEGMNAAAPMETAQFDFFIGTWNSDYQVRVSPESPGKVRLQGLWTARYGWQGYAIYDDWVQVGAPPNTSGPAIRSFDPLRREWVMHYIPINAPLRAVWRMTGRFDDAGELHGELALTDAQGRPFLQRIHFRDIGPDRFTWSCDRSYDDGETWLIDFGVGQNTRRHED